MSSQHSIPQIQVSDDVPTKSLDEHSIGKKSVSTISLSSISKSFSKKSHVSHFASSVRRKFSENQGKNLMKSVLGKYDKTFHLNSYDKTITFNQRILIIELY